jgi:hypothetical protein
MEAEDFDQTFDCIQETKSVRPFTVALVNGDRGVMKCSKA